MERTWEQPWWSESAPAPAANNQQGNRDLPSTAARNVILSTTNPSELARGLFSNPQDKNLTQWTFWLSPYKTWAKNLARLAQTSIENKFICPRTFGCMGMRWPPGSVARNADDKILHKKHHDLPALGSSLTGLTPHIQWVLWVDVQ